MNARGGSAQVLTLLAAMAALGCSNDRSPGEERSRAPMSSAGTGAAPPAAMNAAGSRAASAGASGAGGSATSGASAPAIPALDANAILRGSCATSTVQSMLLPANLLFVVDRTGTMACNPPPTTDSASCEELPERADPDLPSKWEITSEALIEAMKSLPESAKVGISYFSNDSACGVHSTPSVPLEANTDAHQRTMEASLRNVTPGGGTPLVGATILAYKHLHELAVAGSITGNEFVVLITDGEQSEQCSNPPECTDAQSCYALLLDEEVERAAAPGVDIRTFVIGAPGSEPARSVLSTIASRGGTGSPGCDPARGDCHFDMTMESDFGQALSRALAAIIGQASTCELNIPQPEDGGAVDLERINVVRTPSGQDPLLVPQDERAPCDAGADGWQYTEDLSKIRLCGPACDAVRADTGGRVDVVLGCLVQGPD
jgi:hypothetical protein